MASQAERTATIAAKSVPLKQNKWVESERDKQLPAKLLNQSVIRCSVRELQLSNDRWFTDNRCSQPRQLCTRHWTVVDLSEGKASAAPHKAAMSHFTPK